ncbi:MAG: FTR1 family protein [Thermomicrobiales bacterium]
MGNKLGALVIMTVALTLVRPVAEASAEGVEPAAAAAHIQDALFVAQGAALRGDREAAQAAVEEARSVAAPLLAMAGAADAGAASVAEVLAEAAQAVAIGNDSALAMARGRAWTALLRLAYAQTMEAVAADRPEEAASWLRLRDFREATRFSRPAADATLAVRDFAAGTIPPEQAAQIITADLLDTYQAQLDVALTDADAASRQGMTAGQAEAVGKAAGYWELIAPAYEEQFGPAARQQADARIKALVSAVDTGETEAFLQARSAVSEIVHGFRAAPLSEAEQARRAGQLLRYLSLIPVEYGRGVKDGQVVLEIEIHEAQSFTEGAVAAFNDLRLPLQERDEAATNEVAATLARLDSAIRAAGRHESVANPGEIESAADQATASLKSLFPDEWERAGGDADFDVVAALLDQMEAAVAAGQYRQAESARLEAYAIYDVGPEKRLLAFDPDRAAHIERLFWQGDGDLLGLSEVIADEATSGTVRQTRLALDKELASAQRLLGAGTSAEGAVVFNAAVIVFREGLEAVLILASLMASMIGANRRFKRPLMFGALAALLASAALFALARDLLMSLSGYGEKVEAIVSLIAIGVLLLVMNWFFHKVYWTRWIARHHTRRRVLIGGAAGQLIGLGVLGFTSVFREGAETVLFLQALVFDAGTRVVIEGTMLGLLATAVVGVLVFVLQTKLPHKKMLTVTGVLIAAVLVTMVGNTVHLFQVVGWATIDPVEGVEFPYWLGVWFGVYATWQGIIIQAAAGLFVVGSYVVAERMQQRSRQRTVMAGTTA